MWEFFIVVLDTWWAISYNTCSSFLKMFSFFVPITISLFFLGHAFIHPSSVGMCWITNRNWCLLYAGHCDSALEVSAVEETLPSSHQLVRHWALEIQQLICLIYFSCAPLCPTFWKIFVIFIFQIIYWFIFSFSFLIFNFQLLRYSLTVPFLLYTVLFLVFLWGN